MLHTVLRVNIPEAMVAFKRHVEGEECSGFRMFEHAKSESTSAEALFVTILSECHGALHVSKPACCLHACHRSK